MLGGNPGLPRSQSHHMPSLQGGEIEGPGGDDGYRKGGDERGVDAEGQVKCRDLGFGLKVDQ